MFRLNRCRSIAAGCWPPRAQGPTLIKRFSRLRASRPRLVASNTLVGRAMSSHTPSDMQHDFFRYTSGRWLWDEETRLRERYRWFDVLELQAAAAKSVGAKKCVSMVKIAEGNFNRVFRLHMDNSSTVIARIPTLRTGSSRLKVASEVATMDFALSILGIPVPKVLAWSMEDDNPVQAEYIIMEEAEGSQLRQVWTTLSLDSKLKIVADYINIEKKLLSVSFLRFGSLYFAQHGFPGCIKAQIEGNYTSSTKAKVENRFAIGPMADDDFWEDERKDMSIDRGPWEQPQDYLKAIAKREAAWLSEYADRDAAPTRVTSLIIDRSQHLPEAHLDLYDKFERIAEYILPSDKRLLQPAIWYWDTSYSNIFVQGNKISSIIDWVDTCVGPLYLQARRPRFVTDNEDALGELYSRNTSDTNPLLHEILNLPHRDKRVYLHSFAHDTWNNDILPFRECLIQFFRRWDEFCPSQPCPIQFTSEELAEHFSRAEGWNKYADFWDVISPLVQRDGWTENETYDEAAKVLADTRADWLEFCEGEEMRAQMELCEREEMRASLEQATRWMDKSLPQ
ncbi:kinase-like domain-containing protein [Nemania sp. FL0916]|nr:kinase-like domain-containing protein [Nemania sp. FL0916]